MISSDLSSVFNLFRKSSETETKKFFNEVVLMTLARATSSDSNIKDIEVEQVRSCIKEVTGEDVPIANIRVAANSHIYESAPIERYLIAASNVLDLKQKLTILSSLVNVIKSDERITTREVLFFNMVARALQVSPADLLGLIPEA
ncbi:MAG: TerB family tellurite resistance protein [Gammaproteobacteria bacterium]|nr:TerB family tellurite resistance protein [Gammaproteobacteria bacterium]MDE0251948.1 TerB family tellurite resistance protein [Gammaproteobacteria bacterium]MDE0403044.1 TerB family tellurite resistance protein [Gammaproteobacteria bacterium]MDE0645371.1 TerB family tellurite resistance protein [Gammaproteobacteria bacterium]